MPTLAVSRDVLDLIEYVGERVYGVDNLRSWHYHPFQAVEQHLPCPEPSVDEVFEKIKGIVRAL